jgi:hypothetical protein
MYVRRLFNIEEHFAKRIIFCPKKAVLRNVTTINKVVFGLWKICSTTTIEQNLSQKNAPSFQAGQKILIRFPQERQQQEKKLAQ